MTSPMQNACFYYIPGKKSLTHQTLLLLAKNPQQHTDPFQVQIYFFTVPTLAQFFVWASFPSVL